MVPIRVGPQVFVDILAPNPRGFFLRRLLVVWFYAVVKQLLCSLAAKVFLRYLHFRCNPRRPLPQLEQRGLSRCGVQRNPFIWETCTASLPSTICLQLPWSGLPRYFGRPSLWKGLTRRIILLTEIAKGNIQSQQTVQSILLTFPSQLPVHYEGRRVPKSDPFCTVKDQFFFLFVVVILILHRYPSPKRSTLKEVHHQTWAVTTPQSVPHKRAQKQSGRHTRAKKEIHHQGAPPSRRRSTLKEKIHHQRESPSRRSTTKEVHPQGEDPSPKRYTLKELHSQGDPPSKRYNLKEIHHLAAQAESRLRK